jgi:hypothetical protein
LTITRLPAARVSMGGPEERPKGSSRLESQRCSYRRGIDDLQTMFPTTP